MFNQRSYNQKLSRMSKRRESFYQLNKTLRELSRAHNKLEKQQQYQGLVIEDLNERLNELENPQPEERAGLWHKVRSILGKK